MAGWLCIRAQQHRQRIAVIDVRVGDANQTWRGGGVLPGDAGVKEDLQLFDHEAGPHQRPGVPA